MAARGILMALALCVLLPATLRAQGRSTPSPELLDRLHAQHHDSDWWHVTTESASYEVRVRVINADGLAGITTKHKAPPAPELIRWDSITRIESNKLRGSHATRNGMLIGMSAGLIPIVTGNGSAVLYMALGGWVGAGIGAKVVESSSNLHELYVAPEPSGPLAPIVAVPASARPESAIVVLPSGAVAVTALGSNAMDKAAAHISATATLDSVAPLTPSEAVPAATTSAALASSPEVASACQRTSSKSVLRLGGDFGIFHGSATSISTAGLTGLRVDPRYPSVQSPGTLAWDRIDRMEVLGNSAGSGALKGAVGLAGLAAVVSAVTAFLYVVTGASTNSTSGEIIIASTAVGAVTGAALGAAIGSTIPSWHVVYRRP